MVSPATSSARIEREITQRIDLCDRHGHLKADAVGFSRYPLHRCNVRGHSMRKKRWNYWAVTSGRYLFSATIAHLDYMALAFVYFVEFETGRFIEQSVPVPFGRVEMPETVYADVRFRHKRLRVTLNDDGAGARIGAKARSFGGQPLMADIAIARPADHETLNVVIPWSEDRFQFTSKQNTLPASGFVTIGEQRFEFPEGAFAVLDYGRGVWKLETFWNWGAASGVEDGRTIGLNLGGGWTDGTGMTENGICVDGRLHKIAEPLDFRYDAANVLQPWDVRTIGSQRVDLRFEPFFERVAKTNLLVLKSEVHQVFGYYSGTVVTDGGDTVRINRLLGWVEQHEARW